MSSTTLNANGYDLARRNIILNKNSKSLPKEGENKDITKNSKHNNNQEDDDEDEYETIIPRAYLRIEDVCTLYLEPPTGAPVYNPDVFDIDAAFNGGRLSLQKILKLLISDYTTLMTKHETIRGGIFADTGDISDRRFSRMGQMHASDMFLKSSDNYERRQEVDPVRITIFDPHGDRWEFEELDNDKKEEEETQSLKIVKTELPSDFFSPVMRYDRPVFSSFDAKGVAERIRKSSKIVVAIGAGLSVAAGICDFRSKNGLYSKLGKYDLPSPESLFTLDYFVKNPELFYKISNEMNLWPGTFAPTYGHHFIRLLEKHGKLSQVFTQNIDCLERAAGISPSIIVEAHGSYATAHCTQKKGPRHEMSTTKLREIVDTKNEAPMCPECGAPVKPDVVFFGEGLPRLFFDRLESEMKDCDLLLVVGSSLQVMPFAFVAGTPDKRRGTREPFYPRVLMNMERVGEFTIQGDREADNANPGNIFDCFLGGDCQATMKQIAKNLGWEQELEEAYQEGMKKIGGGSA